MCGIPFLRLSDIAGFISIDGKIFVIRVRAKKQIA